MLEGRDKERYMLNKIENGEIHDVRTFIINMFGDGCWMDEDVVKQKDDMKLKLKIIRDKVKEIKKNKKSFYDGIIEVNKEANELKKQNKEKYLPKIESLINQIREWDIDNSEWQETQGNIQDVLIDALESLAKKNCEYDEDLTWKELKDRMMFEFNGRYNEYKIQYDNYMKAYKQHELLLKTLRKEFNIKREDINALSKEQEDKANFIKQEDKNRKITDVNQNNKIKC